MQILKIKKFEPDIYFIDENSNYLSLDKLIKTKILATYNNKLKSI